MFDWLASDTGQWAGHAQAHSPVNRLGSQCNASQSPLRPRNVAPHSAAHLCKTGSRRAHLAHHNRDSDHAIAGLVALLTVCGWILGGDEGAYGWVLNASTTSDQAVTPQMMQRLGARPIRFFEAPALFAALQRISDRAGLARTPALYLLPESTAMNAYAIGNSQHSAITLTTGLLRNLTPAEMNGILAHEIAHIRSNDGSAMNWARSLHRTIANASLMALGAMKPRTPLAAMLQNAPVIAELLYLTLSRLRELNADALALEYIEDPIALVTALDKLERHHNGDSSSICSAREDVARLFRSHPPTAERIGKLVEMAH